MLILVSIHNNSYKVNWKNTYAKIIQFSILILNLMYRFLNFLYKKIEFVVNDLGVSRLTAANYLNKLADDKMLIKNKLGTGNYYINEELFNPLTKR